SESVSSRPLSALSVNSRTAERRFSPCFTDSRAKPFSTSSVSMRPPWIAASCTVYQTAINLALEVVIAADAEEADRLLGIGHAEVAQVRVPDRVRRHVIAAADLAVIGRERVRAREEVRLGVVARKPGRDLPGLAEAIGAVEAEETGAAVLHAESAAAILVVR